MIPPWLELLRTSTASARPLIVALASVDSKGCPHVRSVICRKIDEDGSLWFASDARSGKNSQIRPSPMVEVVCWLPATREQFRLAGEVSIISGSMTESRELWRRMTPQSRAMFFWPAPGEKKTLDDPSFTRSSDAAQPPPAFELIVLHPTTVEHLMLSPHPHRRRRWTLGNEWQSEEINP
jgi:pyridoxamine 5'-phosphate oxidase